MCCGIPYIECLWIPRAVFSLHLCREKDNRIRYRLELLLLTTLRLSVVLFLSMSQSSRFICDNFSAEFGQPCSAWFRVSWLNIKFGSVEGIGEITHWNDCKGQTPKLNTSLILPAPPIRLYSAGVERRISRKIWIIL